jgi:hypothetical protein
MTRNLDPAGWGCLLLLVGAVVLVAVLAGLVALVDWLR